MNRTEMMDKLINKIGFEHPFTIQFCQMCEDVEEGEHNDELLYNLLIAFLDLRQYA